MPPARPSGAPAPAPEPLAPGGPAPPFPSSRAHLLAELSVLDLRLRRQVALSRRAANDPLRSLVISDQEIDVLLGSPTDASAATSRAAAPEATDAIAVLNDHAQRIARRRAASVDGGVPLRLEGLMSRFGLTRADLDLVVIALAPEIDLRYERLFAYLQDDLTRKRPTLQLALDLLCRSAEERLSLRERIAPHAPLLRHGLLRLATDGTVPPPMIGQPLSLDARVVDHLLGGDTPDERLRPCAALVEPEHSLAELYFPEALKARLASFVAGPGARIVYLQGHAGSGRRAMAGALCRALGVRLLLVDGEALVQGFAQEEDRDAVLALLLREARLVDAALCVTGVDALVAAGPRATSRVLLALSKLEGPAFATGTLPLEQLGSDAGTCLGVELPAIGNADQARLWARSLAGGPPLDEGLDLLRFAEGQSLPGGRIRDAAATATTLARFRDAAQPRVTTADLLEGCRRHSQPRLGALARKVVSASRWEDLVLPAERMDSLRDIPLRARHRRLVFETWGFDRKLPTGRGLAVLFSGAPGTGKTLAASVIANELGIDLYQIDLSSVVSKYIGETEKHLARLFDEAEGSRAILFFDEADALFGKRSEVKDAHDRYANIETSYLLQRIESHEGMVILASNNRRNIDEAFLRRMECVIEFPPPELPERRLIWERIFPAAVPREPDLDLGLMAQRFELAGGHIRNIALTAAFLAAGEGRAITQRDLLVATRREYQKLGKMVDESKLFVH